MDTGGSAVLSYTLAIFLENQEDQVVYHGSVLSAVVEGLTAGTEYQFKVKATTLVGDSPWSANQFSFLIVDEPSPPLNLELITFDAAHVSFKWQQPISSGGQPLTGFKIYREDMTLAATTKTELATLAAAQFQYTDSTMTSGIAYRYYVLAYNVLGGEGDMSAGLAVTPINEPNAAAAPLLVTKGKDFITVKWVPPTDMGGSEVTKYILYARPEYDPSYK